MILAAAALCCPGVFYLLTVVLAWGLVWPVNKVLLESLSPLWLMAVRSAIASLGLFAIGVYVAIPEKKGDDFPGALEAVSQYLAAEDADPRARVEGDALEGAQMAGDDVPRGRARRLAEAGPPRWG